VIDTLSYSFEYQEEQSQLKLTLLKFKGKKLRPTYYVEMIVAKYSEGSNIRNKYQYDKYFKKYQEEFI
jgi:hypothetical protein